MAVIHTGKKAADFQESWEPADIDTVFISWTDKLNGGSIVAASSVWNLPAGWAEVAKTEDGSVVEDGITYLNTNSATLSTTLTSGTHLIQNKIDIDDGREITRGVYVTIREKL